MRDSYLPHLLLGSRTGRQWGCWFYVFFSGMDQQFCCCELNPVLNISFEWKYLFHNLKYQPATVKNICSLVNFHIRHLFHIWGTIGTKLKEPNDPLLRQFEMLQNKQMEKLTFYICMLPFYKGLKIHLKVKGPCRVQTLHIPRFKNPNVFYSLQLFLILAFLSSASAIGSTAVTPPYLRRKQGRKTFRKYPTNNPKTFSRPALLWIVKKLFRRYPSTT